MLLVTRTYLEMSALHQLRPVATPPEALGWAEVQHGPASFARYLYLTVGQTFNWHERAAWTEEQFRAVLQEAGVSLWLLSYEGSPAGYSELKKHADHSTEIAYLGLLPEFIGRGWGGWLVTQAVRQAWADGARRVWLHTCTLDAPAALPNYLKRGFTPYHTENYTLAESGQPAADSGQ